MKNKPINLIIVVVLVVSAWWVGRVTAGSLDAPTAPALTSSTAWMTSTTGWIVVRLAHQAFLPNP